MKTTSYIIIAVLTITLLADPAWARGTASSSTHYRMPRVSSGGSFRLPRSSTPRSYRPKSIRYQRPYLRNGRPVKGHFKTTPSATGYGNLKPKSEAKVPWYKRIFSRKQPVP